MTTEGDRNHAPPGHDRWPGCLRRRAARKPCSGEVDFAVHSLKDLPTRHADGIALAAVPPRDDPRDALVSRDKLADLPAGARVGTGSPRRLAQLRLLRPRSRGRADPRQRRHTAAQDHATVSSTPSCSPAPVSRRLGRREAITDVFDPAPLVPAPGQGALGWSAGPPTELTRFATLAGLRFRHRAAVTAERAYSPHSGRAVRAPIGLPRRRGGETNFASDAVVAASTVNAQLRLSTQRPPGRWPTAWDANSRPRCSPRAPAVDGGSHT